eukprot:COSAG02_NODE_12610_length_1519_cov_2.772535_1_plen_52_part_10
MCIIRSSMCCIDSDCDSENIDFGALCLVCETQTRNGREKLRRCAVDFREVAV